MKKNSNNGAFIGIGAGLLGLAGLAGGLTLAYKHAKNHDSVILKKLKSLKKNHDICTCGDCCDNECNCVSNDEHQDETSLFEDSVSADTIEIALNDDETIETVKEERDQWKNAYLDLLKSIEDSTDEKDESVDEEK